MKLQTIIPLSKQSKNLIDYNSNMALFGSCFVENIGNKFDYYKFQNYQNPFGVLFHPVAIENLFKRAIDQKKFTEDDIFFHNEQWHCFESHSKLSAFSKDDMLRSLNERIESTKQQINDASHIIITFGTAWTYRYTKSDLMVANCHKIPQKEFDKVLLSVNEITKSLKTMLSLISSINQKASIIFTVSPVRHIKDGFVENSQSKAHLITAIHEFLNQNSSNSNCNLFYFPSYEIMMDEIRDYRFYKEDMIHPNALAITYIWKKFQHVWISNEAAKIMEEVDDIQKGLQHRPFNASTEAHQQFLHNLNQKREQLQKKYPSINFQPY